MISVLSRDIGFGGSIDLAAILDFVDSGHDLIIAADTNASDLIRQIAVECGVDFDEVGLSIEAFHWLLYQLSVFSLLFNIQNFLEVVFCPVCMHCFFKSSTTKKKKDISLKN